MKKVIVIGLVLAMVMGLAAMASAAVNVDTDWYVKLQAGSSATSPTAGTSGSTQYGTVTGGDNGVNTSAPDNDLPYMLSTGVAVVTSSELDTTKTDGYKTDMRAPLLPGETKTWVLSVYARTGYNPTTIYLTGWVTSGGAIDPLGMKSVKLYEGETVIWDAMANPGSSFSNKGFQIQKSWNTGHNPYSFRLVAEALPDVPEPGSMVAMLSGLVGLVGFGIRRRK